MFGSGATESSSAPLDARDWFGDDASGSLGYRTSLLTKNGTVHSVTAAIRRSGKSLAAVTECTVPFFTERLVVLHG